MCSFHNPETKSKFKVLTQTSLTPLIKPENELMFVSPTSSWTLHLSGSARKLLQPTDKCSEGNHMTGSTARLLLEASRLGMSIWTTVSQQRDSRWIMCSVFHLGRSRAKTKLFCYHITYLDTTLRSGWVTVSVFTAQPGIVKTVKPVCVYQIHPAGITGSLWVRSSMMWVLPWKGLNCLLCPVQSGVRVDEETWSQTDTVHSCRKHQETPWLWHCPGFLGASMHHKYHTVFYFCFRSQRNQWVTLSDRNQPSCCGCIILPLLLGGRLYQGSPGFQEHPAHKHRPERVTITTLTAVHIQYDLWLRMR